MSKTRNEIEDKYKWDLSKIYSSEEEINKEIENIKKEVNNYLKYKNCITKNSDYLLEATENYFSIARIFDKLSVYAHMKFDEDKGITKSEEIASKIDKLGDEISEKLAFYTPELLNEDYEKIQSFIKENDKLKKYSFMFEDLFREKEHILTLEQEEMMARLGEVLSNSEYTF